MIDPATHHVAAVARRRTRHTLAPVATMLLHALASVATALASVATVMAASQMATASDWMFLPSTYSHSPTTGERVRQYQPTPPVIVYQRPDYTRSGYRQSRSTIRAGGSLDVYNVVEEFGNEIRPYGEWLYPARPYAVPYDAWGPPFGGVNGEYRSDYRGGNSLRGGYGQNDHRRDDFRRGDFDRGDGRYRDDRRFDTRSRESGRYNGLFDGRGIPGDDEHYLDTPGRVERMNDREFYSNPRGR